MSDYHISKTTASNWQRLQTDHENRLVQRANKTRSQRRVAALGYLTKDRAYKLLDCVDNAEGTVPDILYTVCRAMLVAKGIWEKDHVQRAMSEYTEAYRLLPLQLPDDLLRSDDEDVAGFLYQSLISEGERNRTGQYYTHRRVVADMLGGLTLSDGERFLDPCCGSGAFLLGVKACSPEQLYGYDINPVAVMMARTNLLIKYGDREFVPQVYCRDFLADDDKPQSSFDYVYTNPPWGADKQKKYPFWPISSGERASMVLVKALSWLQPHGQLGCLLPMALLKIGIHRRVRHFLLHSTTISHISLHAGRFDGVFTGFFSIGLSPQPCLQQHYTVTDELGDFHVSLTDDQRRQGRLVTTRQSAVDQSVVAKMEALRHDDLTHSQWALGIITGNNKELVRPRPAAADEEPVFTGRQVQPYVLSSPSAYIRFAPQAFQQCARETLYRAPEKLLYRFIADHPVVAYDNRQRLCLNSANVLIPCVDGLSVKSVCALLNSSLYHYYYKQRFWDIKVLKGNLQQLPFPQLTAEQDAWLSMQVTMAAESAAAVKASAKSINTFVYELFGITPEEQAYIERRLQSKKRKRP